MKFKFRQIVSYAFAVLTIGLLTSCSGNKTKDSEQISDEEFYATQPVVSGQYEADYYNISGEPARKGPFDGRILIALEPDNSGIYVYENGNRVKIDYRLMLDHPFNKGENGVYSTVDKNGNPVEVNTDSTVYILSFKNKGKDVEIFFNPKPTKTASSFEIWERISSQISNK